MHIRAHTRHKPVRARFVARMRENASCTRICAGIFTKLFVVVLLYLMSLSIKFHDDPNFGPMISENMAPILAHRVLLNKSYSKKLL